MQFIINRLKPQQVLPLFKFILKMTIDSSEINRIVWVLELSTKTIKFRYWPTKLSQMKLALTKLSQMTLALRGDFDLPRLDGSDELQFVLSSV